jgi:hypothetical protein
MKFSVILSTQNFLCRFDVYFEEFIRNKVKGLYLMFNNNQKRDKPFHAYETFYIIHIFVFKCVYDI